MTPTSTIEPGSVGCHPVRAVPDSISRSDVTVGLAEEFSKGMDAQRGFHARSVDARDAAVASLDRDFAEMAEVIQRNGIPSSIIRVIEGGEEFEGWPIAVDGGDYHHSSGELWMLTPAGKLAIGPYNHQARSGSRSSNNTLPFPIHRAPMSPSDMRWVHRESHSYPHAEFENQWYAAELQTGPSSQPRLTVVVRDRAGRAVAEVVPPEVTYSNSDRKANETDLERWMLFTLDCVIRARKVPQRRDEPTCLESRTRSDMATRSREQEEADSTQRQKEEEQRRIRVRAERKRTGVVTTAKVATVLGMPAVFLLPPVAIVLLGFAAYTCFTSTDRRFQEWTLWIYGGFAASIITMGSWLNAIL
ncbi:hypothetical protein [Nocardia sp. NPDC057353]|uniref:hypothetical protein n=1 Tax=Nocardia sp. NPDC057353 TaxID=3346104 RepID=UPI00362D5587